jgi:hypothetical protein
MRKKKKKNNDDAVFSCMMMTGGSNKCLFNAYDYHAFLSFFFTFMCGAVIVAINYRRLVLIVALHSNLTHAIYYVPR